MVVLNEMDKTLARVCHALVETDTLCEQVKGDLARTEGLYRAADAKVMELQDRLVNADRIIADQEAIIAGRKRRVPQDNI